MKTKLLFRALFIGVCLAVAGSARGAAPVELLEKGIYTEETKGDLAAATQIYKQIVDDPNASRALAAQAQLRLGVCELKVGNKPKAISALERLTHDFPDKDQLLALVQDQMPALLDEMVKQIEQNYIQEVDRSELLETAIRAIIGKLDNRAGFLRTNDTEFLGASTITEMNVSLDQQIGGVGTILAVESGEIVATPMRNSPALKAGLKAGDRIVKVNGADLAGVKLAEVIKQMRGAPGSTVNLAVRRAGVNDLLNFELTRDTIVLPSVKGAHYRADDTWEFMLDDARKIGYVRLTQIGKKSPAEMEAALQDLRARGMKGLIFDLRNNGGGLLTEAIAIADLFVENGTIVTVKGRAEEKVYSAKPENTYSGFPMVMLVNGQTASAAEVIAGCLQDHQRATVVGERTFGQAIVRAIFPLKSGGALKLPVSAYYRPSGKHVNRYPAATDADEWGIKPDAGHEVVLTEAEIEKVGLDRAARELLNPGEAPKTEVQDRQLQKALECFR